MKKEASALLRFEFDKGEVDNVELRKAWVAAIHAAASLKLDDDRMYSFLIAAIKLLARSNSLVDLKVLDIVLTAGYSRATFFRMFDGRSEFLLKCYQTTCLLSMEVYREALDAHTLSLDEFCRLTANLLYGANCTVPNQIPSSLWQDFDGTHREFHPHLPDLVKTMVTWIASNPDTQNLVINAEELEDVIYMLDWDMLQARIGPSVEFPSMKQYWRLRRMLFGYLRSLN